MMSLSGITATTAAVFGWWETTPQANRAPDQKLPWFLDVCLTSPTSTHVSDWEWPGVQPLRRRPDQVPQLVSRAFLEQSVRRLGRQRFSLITYWADSALRNIMKQSVNVDSRMNYRLRRGQWVAVLSANALLLAFWLLQNYGQSLLRTSSVLQLLASIPFITISIVGALQASRNPSIGKALQVSIVIFFGLCGVLLPITAFIGQIVVHMGGPAWLLRLLMIIGVFSLVSWIIGTGLFAAAWVRWDRQRRRQWSSPDASVSEP